MADVPEQASGSDRLQLPSYRDARFYQKRKHGAYREVAAPQLKLQKSFFCSTGSEANEGAMLLATIYTRRSEFLALTGGLHGRTKLGMSVKIGRAHV